jgi:hypothetical protein
MREYRIRRYIEYKKDTIYYVQMRLVFKNKLINFLYGHDWYSVGLDGNDSNVRKGFFETKKESEALEFIEWCKNNNN